MGSAASPEYQPRLIVAGRLMVAGLSSQSGGQARKTDGAVHSPSTIAIQSGGDEAVREGPWALLSKPQKTSVQKQPQPLPRIKQRETKARY